jgi:pimeloyl-ACP methyl ester carboxylesterase
LKRRRRQRLPLPPFILDPDHSLTFETAPTNSPEAALFFAILHSSQPNNGDMKMKKILAWQKIGVMLFVVGVSMSTRAAAESSGTFQDIGVTVRGEGKPVLMIPGLNSAGAVWDETCAALQPAGVQCHIVQLPGFAGQAPVRSEHFLEPMRDRLLAYLAAKDLHSATVMGHSLGGVLALQMALKEPARIGRLVIVDALPFLPAARAPGATAESAKPIAESMRARMLQGPLDAYRAQIKGSVAGMTRDDRRTERIADWSLASDRVTGAQAMYEIFTTDLRADLGKIHQPALVLGAWAAYAQYGATKDGVRKNFEDQYRQLPGVRIELSETGYHFLMWDDPDWMIAQVRRFVGANPDIAVGRKE